MMPQVTSRGPECFALNVPSVVLLHADIARREGASLFIPVSSPIASLYDALAAEGLAAQGCR
jgi:hypothetical protein